MRQTCRHSEMRAGQLPRKCHTRSGALTDALKKVAMRMKPIANRSGEKMMYRSCVARPRCFRTALNSARKCRACARMCAQQLEKLLILHVTRQPG